MTLLEAILFPAKHELHRRVTKCTQGRAAPDRNPAAPRAVPYTCTMAMTSRLSGRELAIIFAFWTSLATLSAVNQLLDPRGYGLRLMSPAGPIAMAYIESWLWAAFTPVIFWLSSRFGFERSRLIARVPLL